MHTINIGFDLIYAYLCIHTHTYTRAHTYTHTHTHIYTYIYIYMYRSLVIYFWAIIRREAPKKFFCHPKNLLFGGGD